MLTQVKLGPPIVSVLVYMVHTIYLYYRIQACNSLGKLELKRKRKKERKKKEKIT